MIELKNINKTYQLGAYGVQALRDVSLTICLGEFMAIMGPSGSGKSTLMHVLGLLDKPDSGSYFLGRKDVSRISDNDLAFLRNRLCGFVFQQFHLLPRSSALANVGLPIFYSGRSSSKKKALETLSSVRLSERSAHRPNELSGGQQQRVSIARALVNDPMIILADEPTGNLDSKSEEEIITILKQLNKQGKTVVIVTHDPEVAKHVRRVVNMKDGMIISDKMTASSTDEISVNQENVKLIEDILNKKMRTGINLNIGSHIKQAFQAIFSSKLRSFLSMLGILIGVTAVIAMLALGQGAKDSVSQSLTALGSNLLVIRPGSTRIHGVSLESGSVTRFTMKDAEEIRKLGPVKRVYEEVNGRGQIVYKNKNWNTTINGTGIDYAEMKSSVPEQGRFFTEQELKSRQKVAVIGKTIADELFGDKNSVGETIKINRIYFKVIGVFPKKGAMGPRNQDDVIVIPLTTAMYRVLGKNYVDSINVEVIDASLMDEATTAISDLIRKRHNLKDDQDSFQIRDMTEIQDTLKSTMSTMTALLGSIAAISLLVGGIGIMNIMLVSVTERTREIGLRKAIGARKKDILLQFLIESVVLTFSGGFFGIVLGTGISMMLSSLAGWAVRVSFSSVVLATSFSIIIGIGFGLWPARQASKLNPIDALRYE